MCVGGGAHFTPKEKVLEELHPAAGPDSPSCQPVKGEVQMSEGSHDVS
jgi:hypothetical protein